MDDGSATDPQSGPQSSASLLFLASYEEGARRVGKGHNQRRRLPKLCWFLDQIAAIGKMADFGAGAATSHRREDVASASSAVTTLLVRTEASHEYRGA